ncbi:MAG: MMPL family transporter [Bacteroidia bacterium]|nr:MMPL family transporter [Bacteroidia bacterium]
MNNLLELIIKFKWITILTVMVLTAFLGYQISNLKINSDIISSLPDDDSAAALYKKIGTQFGGNEMGMIVLETDNVFKTEVLKHVKQITDSLKITHGISTVTSLTNVIDIKNTDGGIEIGKLFDEYKLPDTKQKLDSLKTYLFSKKMYKGTVVSEDGTATLIMFTLLHDADKQAVAREVKNKVVALNLPEKLYFGGLPMMMNDVSDLIMADIIWLLPIVFVLIAFVLLLSFRSAKGIILPLLIAVISVIWTLGIMVLTGFELTMISNDIPIILLAVGSAYTIHVINRINQTFDDDRKKAIIKALTYIILPVFLAAITTAIGFVSFIFGSYLTIIRDFGLFTAIGVAFSFLLSITFVPAVVSALSIYKNRKVEKSKPIKKSILSDYILKPLVALLFKHLKYTLTFWSVLILLSIGGMFFIKTSVNMADYFKKDNPTRVSEDVMQKKFGGSMPVFISFKGDMQSPDVLKTMIKTEDYMKQYPDISTAQSIADLIEEMNDVMGEGKKIPDEKVKIEQLWFLLDGQDIMPQLVTDNLDEGIIQSKFASVDSKSIMIR